MQGLGRCLYWGKKKGIFAFASERAMRGSTRGSRWLVASPYVGISDVSICLSACLLRNPFLSLSQVSRHGRARTAGHVLSLPDSGVQRRAETSTDTGGLCFLALGSPCILSQCETKKQVLASPFVVLLLGRSSLWQEKVSPRAALCRRCMRGESRWTTPGDSA
jgi:hypothetical protein